LHLGLGWYNEHSSRQVNDAFLSYFRTLLTKPGEAESAIHILQLIPKPAISNLQEAELVKQVTPKEIRDIVFGMKAMSALGPDGFTMHFYQKTWNIIGVDFIRVIQNFFASNKLMGGTNHTKPCLIPKTDQPINVMQFRPIACCNLLYKCISKILATRMKKNACLRSSLRTKLHS